MKLLAHKITPAMAVACTALFVSLGGVSYGVATGSIDSREIKNNSVRSKDVRNNGLTGTDINESRLGQVPTAASANTANTANSASPSGPAGGSLTGTYPNPTLGPDTVSSANVANDTLTGDDVLESSLGIVPNASLLAGRPPGSFLSDSVYKRESAVAAGTDLGDGTFSAAVACLGGDTMLSGGPANVNPTSDLMETFPSPGTTNAWSARIHKNGAADNWSVVVICVDQ